MDDYTLNPDALCNSKVKFDASIKKELLNKFDVICTGHYASLKHGRLHAARDAKKDQSYFLSLVEDWEGVCFPLGGVRKEEVRRGVGGVEELREVRNEIKGEEERSILSAFFK